MAQLFLDPWHSQKMRITKGGYPQYSTTTEEGILAPEFGGGLSCVWVPVIQLAIHWSPLSDIGSVFRTSCFTNQQTQLYLSQTSQFRLAHNAFNMLAYGWGSPLKMIMFWSVVLLMESGLIRFEDNICSHQMVGSFWCREKWDGINQAVLWIIIAIGPENFIIALKFRIVLQ